MPITEILTKNATYYKNDVALVEINPRENFDTKVTWKEYSLIESDANGPFRNEMTWYEFDVMSNKIANLLLTRGVKKGDKVAILLMNCIEWLPIYFGILKTGALAVPLNFRYASDEIKYCVELADVNVLIFGREFIGRIEAIADNLQNIKNMFYIGKDCPSFADNCSELINYCSSHAPSVPLTEEDDAAIYFSSGTTGFPKAILHNHESLTHAMLTEQNHHSQSKEDVFLCIPPLYHTGAKMHWLGSFMVGGKSVILKGVKPEWIMRTISEEMCTIVWLLVPWAQDILDSIDSGIINLSELNLEQWRLMHIGAQPVPPSLIKRWKEVFPNHDYDTNYGLSESIGPGCVHLGVKNIHKVGAIGVPGYKWEVKIIDENGNTVEQGSVGELAIKGPGVMKCYYKDVKATNEVLHDGWLYTGDMAEQDKDGFYYLVDRKKDVIITGGENIYPVQIENFIRKNDKIKDAAVIGLPDARLGEIAAAIVELKDGCQMNENEFNEFCNSLPRYKRPRKVFFADIPRNPTGKIEKPKLRILYCGDKLVAKQNEII